MVAVISDEYTLYDTSVKSNGSLKLNFISLTILHINGRISMINNNIFRLLHIRTLSHVLVNELKTASKAFPVVPPKLPFKRFVLPGAKTHAAILIPVITGI
jgi:hypothetical protein